MYLKNAEQINVEIAAIPVAVEQKVYVGSSKKWQKNFKAIEVDGEIVSIPSKHYKLVQHEEAFRPVVEALTLRGVEDFKFSLFANHRRAWLNIFVGEGFDTVKFGFRVLNSVDRSTSVRYGLSAFTESRVLELVGYRQVCSNGMIVRVNLDDAEFVKLEERTQIDTLLRKKIAFAHTGDVKEKLEEVQYVVEAFTLLRNPLERIIKKAQSIKLTKDQAEAFIRKYVGVRKLDKVKLQYGQEEQTLWGLYNSITFLASHGREIKATKMNTMLEKAADLLENEIKVEVPA